jgi:putative CocE/NonD family hydrolase
VKRWGIWVGLAAVVAVLSGGLEAPARATTAPALVTENLTFKTADGTLLHASVAGYGSLARRPVIFEDSPYSPAVSTLGWVGSQFNFVELQWQGTGDSGGSLATTGPEDQTDLAQFLGWACTQSWSDGKIGLYGFSASAIVVYNSMHLQLPCVKAAALMAGTTDLYRDLFYIGGIFNAAAGAFVEAAVGEPTLADGATRLQDDPSSIPATALGYPDSSVDVLANQTETAFWDQRTFQGDADRIPILADTSFYDVEPDGPFAAFNATKQFGSHLLVYGAHDGSPAGTPGPFPQYQNWFAHYLLGAPLSPANQPTVSLYLGDGSRQQFLNDSVTHLTGTAWPLPGTRWSSLYLSATKSTSTSAGSVNNGFLASARPSAKVAQSYPFVPSELTETDLHNTSVIDGEMDELDSVLPATNDMQLSGATALTYTSAPLTRALTAVGPGALDVYASTLAPVTDLYVVVADVWPDGTAYPIASGALRTSYPAIDRSRSLVDAAGDVVDPYAVYSSAAPALPGQTREYQVALLPLGNQFAAGSRIRVYILGTPADQVGALPGINTVSLGGLTPSRLLLPTWGAAPSFGS